MHAVDNSSKWTKVEEEQVIDDICITVAVRRFFLKKLRLVSSGASLGSALSLNWMSLFCFRFGTDSDLRMVTMTMLHDQATEESSRFLAREEYSTNS
jgi:hypothetical protein